MGAVGYADDMILLAPSRNAAQRMLRTCEQFAAENNIRFLIDSDPSKSKSKVMYVVRPKGDGLQKPKPLQLCDENLPLVAGRNMRNSSTAMLRPGKPSALHIQWSSSRRRRNTAATAVCTDPTSTTSRTTISA